MKASIDDEEVEESSTNVVDLMEVLKERLQGKLRERSASQSKTRQPKASELKSKSKAELYEMAQVKEVPGRSIMSKSKLIEALTN